MISLHSTFLLTWLASFLPYVAACALILRTKAGTGIRAWMEWSIILLGAVLLRALFLPVPPNLSPDSWRYLWDARVILHGYSPYVYAPGNPLFIHLRDMLFQNIRFRNVPTIYPPAAQAVFLLSYLIASSNLVVLKGIFMLFDLMTCGVLVVLLRRRGLDPRRVILYAWCPLPIIEFAMQGHLDVIIITLMVLAVFCNQGQWRGARILTGFLIAVATLTKYYPLLLLPVMIRRHDWPLLLACFGTIFLGYLPFLLLGHGQVLGYFSGYASDQGGNAGVIQLLAYWLGLVLFGHDLKSTIVLAGLVKLESAVDLVVIGTAALIVLVQRWRDRISVETATLLLIGIVLACSSHVFPWYTAVFLPWVAMEVGPLWKASTKGLRDVVVSSPLVLKLRPQKIAFAVAWYFPSISILSYFCVTTNQWDIYYIVAYVPVLGGLGLAALLGIQQGLVKEK